MKEPDSADNLIGLVLCGGLSTRMGTDKGMIQGKHASWAEETEAKLNLLGLEAVFSVNANQFEPYSILFQPKTCVVDSLKIPGPLNGILSTHLRFTHKDLLVIACDMPFMNQSTLKALYDAYHDKPHFGVYFYEKDGFKEPLCSIFRKEILAGLYAEYTSANLTQFSLQKILTRLPGYALEPGPGNAFENANTPADIQ